MIPFCKTYLSGNESKYLQEVLENGQISGNGKFTKLCQTFFEQRYGFEKCLLTSSCTSALEMAALLLRIGPKDEVIVPSYTFTATANAFVLRGARIVFADSSSNNPNVDVSELEKLITERTKAIVVVHYGGIACDMDKLISISEKHGVPIIEDAAHAIDAKYKERPLGSFGSISTFSFHQTKNIVAGEAGMLVINDPNLVARAEIIWENGTNRAAFHRGEVDKYTWVDLGSSYLASELSASFLYSQLEALNVIQKQRKLIWNYYFRELSTLNNIEGVSLPDVPTYADINGHLFYLLCRDEEQRDSLISYLRSNGVYAVFHYNSLHKSPFYSDVYTGKELTNADDYSETLVRLPLFYELTENQLEHICSSIKSFFLA